MDEHEPVEKEDDVYEGAFNFVLPDTDQQAGPRRLPGLYMGTTLFFAHRDARKVVAEFSWMASALDRSTNVPTFTMHPVRVGNVYGLYARDFFNRASYRRTMMRLGMEFEDHAFVTLPNGRFESEEWGPFDVRFFIMSNPDPDEPGPVFMTSAQTAFAITTYRIGAPMPDEIKTLIALSPRMKAMAGEDPAALVEVIRSISPE